eukprot:5461542-Pyramimonas_sp.AAC.1
MAMIAIIGGHGLLHLLELGIQFRMEQLPREATNPYLRPVAPPQLALQNDGTAAAKTLPNTSTATGMN